MLHYWCLPDLHTKFHASAATIRSAATCWKIGCYQQNLSKSIGNCSRVRIFWQIRLKLCMLHYWCVVNLQTKFHGFAATRRFVATCWKIGCYQQNLSKSIGNCSRVRIFWQIRLKLCMLHYWCIVNLQTKFHEFAATRRFVATC